MSFDTEIHVLAGFDGPYQFLRTYFIERSGKLVRTFIQKTSAGSYPGLVESIRRSTPVRDRPWGNS